MPDSIILIGWETGRITFYYLWCCWNILGHEVKLYCLATWRSPGRVEPLATSKLVGPGAFRVLLMLFGESSLLCAFPDDDDLERRFFEEDRDRCNL